MQKSINDVKVLRRWAVCQHFVSGAYLRIYLSESDCLQVLHTTPLGVVPCGIYEH